MTSNSPSLRTSGMLPNRLTFRVRGAKQQIPVAACQNEQEKLQTKGTTTTAFDVRMSVIVGS